MFLGAGCGHLRILGNGCGRRKRFTTAHCGFERSKHNGRLFVRSAKWRVLHLFLEAGWRQRHCSESLKIGESATARAVICNIWRTIGPQPHCWGKVSLNVEWVKNFRLPAPMKFLRPDFKISRLSPESVISKREAKANSKWEKITFFVHHIANSILPWPWLEKESLGNGNHFERLKVGRSFASVCRNARHLNQITNNCSKKRKNKQFSNATPGCSWFPNKKN